MTNTVATIEPLGGPLVGGTMTHNFGGAITGNAGTVIPVRYPASTAPDSIDRGVLELQTVLLTTPGDIMVFAHSQGAQVVSRWLRTHAADMSNHRNRITFLLIGNPLRRFGGFGVGKPEFGGAIGQPTPDDTGFHVTDVKLQYDGWADHPTKPGRWAAINAATDRYGILGSRAIHAMGYRTARLDDPGRAVYRTATTDYVMLPHPPLLKVPQTWIEQSYARPERPPTK